MFIHGVIYYQSRSMGYLVLGPLLAPLLYHSFQYPHADVQVLSVSLHGQSVPTAHFRGSAVYLSSVMMFDLCRSTVIVRPWSSSTNIKQRRAAHQLPASGPAVHYPCTSASLSTDHEIPAAPLGSHRAGHRPFW